MRFVILYTLCGVRCQLGTDAMDTAYMAASALSRSMQDVHVEVWQGMTCEVRYVNGDRTYHDLPVTLAA